MKVDAHQHFWNLNEVEYLWPTPKDGPMYANFEPGDLEPHLRQAGIDRTVLVQAANSYEDTASMLRNAHAYPWIGAGGGWVELLHPDATRKRLEMYTKHPKFRGVRHLIHDEPDPDWVMQDVVIESLKILAQYSTIFQVVGVFPNHLKYVPVLAQRIPDLKLVIDHLAKPPIAKKQMAPWTDQMNDAAIFPNVYAKLSGLNTAASANWDAAELKPYIDFAFDCFGADRLMFGSDWPVCLLAGDFNRVWTETNKALAGRSATELEAVLGGTAQKLYRIV